MKRVLLFDYDGTILDSVKVALYAFNTIGHTYGIPRFRTVKDFVKIYEGNFYKSKILANVERPVLDEFLHNLRAPFIEKDKEMKVFNGMREVLKRLSKKNDIIVITSNLTHIITHSIQTHQLSGIKEVIGGDIEHSKIVKINMIRKRYPKAELIYIGDTVGDVLEAKKAKVVSVAVSWGYHTARQLIKSGPDYLVSAPRDLLKLFG